MVAIHKLHCVSLLWYLFTSCLVAGEEESGESAIHTAFVDLVENRSLTLELDGAVPQAALVDLYLVNGRSAAPLVKGLEVDRGQIHFQLPTPTERAMRLLAIIAFSDAKGGGATQAMYVQAFPDTALARARAQCKGQRWLIVSDFDTEALETAMRELLMIDLIYDAGSPQANVHVICAQDDTGKAHFKVVSRLPGAEPTVLFQAEMLPFLTNANAQFDLLSALGP